MMMKQMIGSLFVLLIGFFSLWNPADERRSVCLSS